MYHLGWKTRKSSLGRRERGAGSTSNLPIPAWAQGHHFPEVLSLAASLFLPSLGVAGTPGRNCAPPLVQLGSGGMLVPEASL